MNNALDINPEPAHEASQLPLLHTAKNGYDNHVRDPLKYDFEDPDETNNDGSSPLWWVTNNGYDLIDNLLLEVKSVNINSRNHDGLTPFLAAIDNSCTSIARILIGVKNIDVNISDNDDCALFYVTSYSNQEMAEVLVRFGKISTYKTFLLATPDDSDSKKMLLTATGSPAPLY